MCERVFSGKSPKYSTIPNSNITIGQAANTGLKIDLSLSKYCTDEFMSSMPDYYFLKKHDILLNSLGHGTLGRSGIYNLDNNKVLTDGHLFVFRTFNEYTSQILLKYLQVNRTNIEKTSNGSTNQIFLSLTTVENYLIPLPPLAEQQRIVEKIESMEPCLAEYDKIEKQLTKLESEIKDKLKKSILQYAIQGKLVKQDPNDEPASVLLERIKAEKEQLIKEGKIKRDKNESFIYKGDDKNYYENLPKNWVLTTLSAAGNWKSGSTPDRHNSKYYDGSIPWIKTGELNDNLELSKSEEHITELALNNCSLSINPPGNVLVAMYGATIGKLAINNIPVTTNQACCGCTPYNDIFNKFLFYFIMANKQKLIDLGAGGAQPNISKEKIQSFYFYLIPKEEQYKIVRTIETLLNIIK